MLNKDLIVSNLLIEGPTKIKVIQKSTKINK